MISICVTIKNRSRVTFDGRKLLLFPRCVESIVRCVSVGIPCEMVVTDWHSDDWPLAEWLPKAAKPVPSRIIPLDGYFSRGKGLNRAAQAALGNDLFFLDADCLISPNLLREGLAHLRSGRAFFPIFYSFKDPEHREGVWRPASYGMCMVSREMYERAGGWPEYKHWGKEDDDFFARVSTIAEVVRSEVPGFYHQWHPNDIFWKDRYSEKSPEEEREIEQILLARKELAALIPADSTAILVDEGRFGLDPVHGRMILPFMEKDGDYWGLPPDDATAISEFERLRSRGTRWLAFAWMAFWWLEYYRGFNEYLRSRFSCVLQNDRLMVFDLCKGSSHPQRLQES